MVSSLDLYSKVTKSIRTTGKTNYYVYIIFWNRLLNKLKKLEKQKGLSFFSTS